MPARAEAGGRAGIYHLLALAFDYPVPELHRMLVDGSFRERLWALQDILGAPRIALPLLAGDLADFQADYTGLFDLGRNGGAPCSLHESAYLEPAAVPGAPRTGGARNWLFEDLLRFYHHFGLRMTQTPSERLLPDHLVCELEMMAFLSYREAGAALDEQERHGCRQARIDFVARHLGRWVPTLASRLGAAAGEAAAFFAQLASALPGMEAERDVATSDRAVGEVAGQEA